MNQEFAGTRWHKCDLHLHTPASLCFYDQTITPEAWVQEALDKGLHCVAVTDHNTNGWIENIQRAAAATPLTVFPGVEITCSDAKIHLLILFDHNKTHEDVYDFLIKAGIEREQFCRQDAHTNRSVEEIATLADSRGALVIPAHIDEYNGICQLGNKILKDFLALPSINAVQVVHQNLYEGKSGPEVNEALQKHYGRPIEQNLEKSWKTAVREAQLMRKAIVTFSDNPHAEGDSRHGLWGMGRRFTWIKMEKTPCLEGLRQAFLTADLRVKNDFECPEGRPPHLMPKQWLRKLIVSNTEVNHPDAPLEISFSPQLTTIIGGRGSGKSSVLRFIRCLFQNKIEELYRLGDKSFVYRDFADFFQFPKGGTESGVLKSGTLIQLYFHRHGVDYRIEYRQKDKRSKELAIYRYDTAEQEYARDDSEGLADLFQFDIFSQKQIYDIGSKPNSLRDRIDSEVPEIAAIKLQLDDTRNKYYEKSTEVRSIQNKVQRKARLKTEIADLEARQQELFKGSTLLKEREKFEAQEQRIDNFKMAINRHIDILSRAIGDFVPPPSPAEGDLLDARLEAIIQQQEVELQLIVQEIGRTKDSLEQTLVFLDEDIARSTWQAENEDSRSKLETTQQQLVDSGFSLDDIQQVSDDLKVKKGQLEEIENEEARLDRALKQKEVIKETYFDARERLTKERTKFLTSLLRNSSVRAKVRSYQDLEDFESQLRKILNTDHYAHDFQKLKERLLQGRAKDKCAELVQNLITYRQTGDRSLFDNIDGRLLNAIKGLDKQQLDDIDLLAPEDEIVIEYKPNQSSSFKSISNLSAGQKTASILTILLTHKDTPLILDQPEDDLDSFLIYDLIVEQLKKSKEFRQIIVVSHNANVPVNGDSEHIVIMNSESQYVEKLEAGSIDKKEVKEFVLKVMEGGKDAFDYRSKRYKIS